MPVVSADTIRKMTFHLFEAAGAPQEYAETMAEHITQANLIGQDSHGLFRVPQYLNDVKQGRTDPEARPEVILDTPAVAVVNGRRTFGQVVGKFATELAMEKAKDSIISMVTFCNMGHTGRVGTYPEMVARAGMAALMWTGIIGGPVVPVVPFGGREGRLCTNPIAMSFPCGMGDPVLLDFATSMAAEGKIRVFRNRGERLPDVWILDKNGNPSRNPEDLYSGGLMLPIGGVTGGHKGYALCFLIGLLGGTLPHMACCGTREDHIGATIVVIDVGRLVPPEDLKEAVDGLIRYVKDTPPMEGFKEVMYPGEIASRTRKERLQKGIPIEDVTWRTVMGFVKEFGLEKTLAPLPS